MQGASVYVDWGYVGSATTTRKNKLCNNSAAKNDWKSLIQRTRRKKFYDALSAILPITLLVWNSLETLFKSSSLTRGSAHFVKSVKFVLKVVMMIEYCFVIDVIMVITPSA